MRRAAACQHREDFGSLKVGVDRSTIALVLMMSVGLGLRWWGIGFGLPDIYHPDEGGMVETALRFGRGDLNPHNIVHPPLLAYILFTEYMAYFLLQLFVGAVRSPADFALSYYKDPTVFFLIARATVAVFGAATMLNVYLIGRQLYGVRVGLVSAAMLSVTFLHVEHSHYIKGDVIGIYLVTLSFLFAARLFHGVQARRSGALSGLFAGLAGAAHLLSVFAVFPLLMAHLLAARERGSQERPDSFVKGIGASLLFVLVGFFLGHPFAILDFRANYQQFRAWAPVGVFSRVDPVPMSSAEFYLFYALPYGMGIGLAVASAIGLLYGVYRHKRADLLCLAFLLSLGPFLLIQVVHLPRYAVFLIPFLLMMAARMITDALQRAPWATARSPAVLAVIVGLLVLPSLASDIRFGYMAGQKDTRRLAREWIEAHLPSESRIAVEGSFDWDIAWGPNLMDSRESMRERLATREVVEGKGPFNRYRMLLERTELPQRGYRLLKEHSLHHKPFEYYRQNVDYVVASSYVYARSGTTPTIYRRFDEEFSLVKEFVPFPQMRWEFYALREDFENLAKINPFGDRKIVPGPVIRIYRVPAAR